MDEEHVVIDPSNGINIHDPNNPGDIDNRDNQSVGMDDGPENSSMHSKSKVGTKKSGGVSSVASTYRNYKNGKKRSFCANYWICFFLKNPVLNPIFARHPRVNRLSRGLIHYTNIFIVLNILIAFLQPEWAIWAWWSSALFSYPCSIIFSRVFTEVSYWLHDVKRKGMVIAMSIIYLIVSILFQVFTYFDATWLEWQQFKQLWWLGPYILVWEWIAWELIVNCFHVKIGTNLAVDSKTYGKKRACREKWVSGVIYSYLDAF